jgi:hypothetical protein
VSGLAYLNNNHLQSLPSYLGSVWEKYKGVNKIVLNLGD